MRDLDTVTNPRIIVIGAGPGGVCMGIKLREAGFVNFTILEKAPGIGGTWWYNRYPGAACDVPSHLYSFSFATKRDWSSPYAGAAEILEYMRACADRFGVTPHVRTDRHVTGARWDDAAGCWHCTTADGASYSAEILIAAQGMFNEPIWPDIPGIDTFAGTQFHTARWDHGHDLAGRRVGIIGSAASAVQCVPEVARVAGRLTLFQRTPNWIMPKKDRPYSATKREYFLSTPDAVESNRARFFEQFDGFVLLDDPERYRESVDMARANIAIVEDPEIRRQLTPDFAFGCKRILLSSNYYETFNRTNVHLVTNTIRSIERRGVITDDGALHEFDTLIFATGFDVTRYASSVAVTGRDGRRLDDAWRDGAQAYLGITTNGFPNLFQIYGPNTNKGSILFMIECQADYIVRQVRRIAHEGLASIDVRADVMATYNDAIQADANAIAVWAENCNNYFRDRHSGRIVTQYPRDMSRYRADTVADDRDAYVVERRPPVNRKPA